MTWAARRGCFALAGLLWLLSWAPSAHASDCPPDDPSRSDCKAAAQTAENPLVPIAGAVVGAVVAIVVNGVLVGTQTIKVPAAPQPPAKPGEKPKPPKHYTLDLKTTAGKTSLKTDSVDTVTVSAQVLCDDPTVNVQALTAALRFGADGPNASWLLLMDGGMPGGRRTVTVRAWPPTADAQAGAGQPRVECGAVIEGQPVSGAVPLTLDQTPYASVVQYEPAAGLREYRGVKFTAPNEFAADGEDQLTFTAFVCDARQPQTALPNGLVAVSLPPDNADYEVRLDPGFNVPGQVRGWVRAKTPQLHTADRARAAVRLKLDAKVKSPLGDEAALPPKEAALAPRRLYFKLWVVPGARTGTSEAGAFVCLAPNAADVLAGVKLNLSVTNLGAGALTHASDAAQTTDADGLARWTLTYSGLTWKTIGDAQFKVAVCLQGPAGPPTQAVTQSIHVGVNLKAMTEALDAAHEALDLTNHEWDQIERESWRWWVLPRMWRGPAYNIRAFFANGPTRYTCGELRDRIFEWGVKRRFGAAGQDPAELASMNGVELGKYFIAPVHVFAGFHFSGGDPSDAYMVDPWWTQAWDDHTVLSMTTELGKLSSFLFAGLPLLAPLLAQIGAAATTEAAWAVAHQYFLGSAVSKVTSAVIGTGVAYAGYSFRWGVDTQEYLEDGRYKDYRQPRRSLGPVSHYWLKEYTDGWRSARRAVPFMEGLA